LRHILARQRRACKKNLASLPPGVDVNRASLEAAMQSKETALCRYEIQPDRVVVYLWPAGRTARFQFEFRPRYGMNAQTAASELYDYYNVDVRATVRPTRFIVREAR
jgi:hypothetical protein